MEKKRTSTNEMKNKLETVSAPLPPQGGSEKAIRLAILSARKSSAAALWILLAPGVVLLSGLLSSLFRLRLPPWRWLETYSPTWPVWMRFSLFATLVIILPLIAVMLNILAILWIRYDRAEKVLHISVKMRTTNLIIIATAGLLACLFLGHIVADFIAGAD